MTLPAFVASALLACCGPQGSAPPAANWPQPGMNETHAGYNALETSLGAGNVGKLVQRWSFPTGGQIAAPIVVQDGIAFVSSADGYLYAIKAGTGAQVWRFQTFTEWIDVQRRSRSCRALTSSSACLVDGKRTTKRHLCVTDFERNPRLELLPRLSCALRRPAWRPRR